MASPHKVFSIPLKFWYPTPKLQRFDFKAKYNRLRFALEAKGRIDDSNSVAAENSIIKKFSDKATIANYDHALGVIYTPCFCENNKPTIHPKDILLIDPENSLPPLDDLAGVRSILRHYSYIYKAQGYDDLFNRMIAIADNKKLFSRYIDYGIQDLPRVQYYRTSFSIHKVKYVGTAWSDQAGLFNSGNDDSEAGVYIWAIKKSIHEAIIHGDIKTLLNAVHDESDFWDGQYRYILLSDGSAIGWAPNKDSLIIMP